MHYVYVNKFPVLSKHAETLGYRPCHHSRKEVPFIWFWRNGWAILLSNPVWAFEICSPRFHQMFSLFFRYLKTEDEEASGDLYKWWHTKLADFFSKTDNINRKIEVTWILEIFCKLRTVLFRVGLFRSIHDQLVTVYCLIAGWPTSKKRLIKDTSKKQ